jgi:hypothetical protein
VPYRVVSRRHPAIASWPPVRPWSLEGVATTPWPPTTPAEDALNGVRDVCAAVCCRAACTTVVPGTGRLGTCSVEEAASPSTTKSTEVSARCSMICTIMLGQGNSKNLMSGPYLARQMSESKSPAGWRSAPALNPKMRRGLGVLLVG